MTTNYERAAHILDNTFELDQTQELAAAQAHATVAVADALEKLGPWIKEIGDQLDTMPRHRLGDPNIESALALIRHESTHSRDLQTRQRLAEALAYMGKLFVNARPEMASTGTIDDAEHTS